MARNTYRGRKRGATVLASSGLHYSGLPTPNFETAMRAFNCTNISGQQSREPVESMQQPSNSRDTSKEKSSNHLENFTPTRKRNDKHPSESAQKRVCVNNQSNRNYHHLSHNKSEKEIREPSPFHQSHQTCYFNTNVSRTPNPPQAIPFNMPHQPEGTILVAYQPQIASPNGTMNLNYSPSPIYHQNNMQMSIEPPTNVPSHSNLKYKDLKMGDFITQLCTRENVTEDNVSDSFFRELVSMLLEFMDIFPGIKPKIQALLCPLIDFGTMYSTRDQTYSSAVNQNSNFKSCDHRINHISTLLKIDKKIDTLMRQKLNIYPEILKPAGIDVVDIETYDTSDNDHQKENENRLDDIIPDSDRPNESVSNKVDSNCTVPNNPINTSAAPAPENVVTFENIKQEIDETVVTTKFYPKSLVEQLCKEQTQRLKVIKMELLGQYQHETTEEENVDSIENRQLVSTDTTMEQADPQDESSANHIPNHSTSSSGSTDEVETDSLLKFQLPEIKNTILCINIVQEACIVGCNDGCLMLFSTANGMLLDSVFPSAMPIVSITVYQNKIVTASEDSILKCYNTSTKKIKSTSVNHPISCTHDSNGKLYVGTASGHMVVFNLKSMAILCQPTQISSTPVTCIRMYETEDIIAVACVGKPIMFRNSSTGALLQSIKLLSSISHIVFTDDFSKMICSKHSKLLEYVPSTGSVTKKSVGMKISILQHHKCLVIVGGMSNNDGNGVVKFYSKDEKAVGTIKMLPGKPLALSVYSDASVFLSTSKARLIHIHLPNEVKSCLEDYNKRLACI